MKKLFAIAAAGMLTVALTACSNNGGDSEVIVKTSAGDISKAEFYKEMKTSVGKKVLQNMVLLQLLDKKYDVSDDLDKQVKQIKDRFDSDDKFQSWLEQQGFKNEDQLREAVKGNLLVKEARTGDVKVSDEEVRGYYEKHKKDQYTKIKVSNIVVEKKSEAETIKNKLNGSNFAEMAKQHSIGNASKNGGDLGYITKQSNMVKPFLDAAFKLDVGEVSEPVKSNYGWHLIKVTDKKEVPFKDVKEQIKQQLTQQQAKPVNEVINELYKEGKIEVKDDYFDGLFKVQEPQKQQSGDATKKESNEDK
ncbi:MAG TPA: peptidylprolyl isomerase [Bacillales bacterium]|nr:peptidylprolyl isomerase [Bacillales bacterium]HEU5141335.1 peptidylprolyl isomerase [Bacillales bacterium]